MTTTEKLERIKAVLRLSMELSEKATCGPWREGQNEDDSFTVRNPYPRELQLARVKTEPDAAFIAHARTMLPATARALLIAIEELEQMARMLPDCAVDGTLGAICREFEGVA